MQFNERIKTEHDFPPSCKQNNPSSPPPSIGQRWRDADRGRRTIKDHLSPPACVQQRLKINDQLSARINSEDLKLLFEQTDGDLVYSYCFSQRKEKKTTTNERKPPLATFFGAPCTC